MDARRLIQRRDYYQRQSALAPQDLWTPIPVLTGLIVHPEGRLLFDVGSTIEWRERWKATGHDDVVPYLEVSEEQRFENLLRTVCEPDEIDWVVVSHLHMDHCGNLRSFVNTKARVVVQEAEFGYATEQVKAPGSAGYVTSEFDVDVRWRLVNGDVSDILAGVDIIALHGHAAGAQGLVVRLNSSGTIIFASDAAYTLESLGPPPIPGATVFDHQKWIQSIERLNRYRRAENALVVAGHDASQVSTLKLGPEQYYE